MARQHGQVEIIIRSTLHVIVYVVSTAVWGILSLLTAPLSYRRRYWFVTRWTHFNLWAFERICGVRCDVQGTEHIPQGQGGIVMAKHQSAWETMALQRWFSPQTWVLKRELLRLPMFGWALALLEPIAIDRGGVTAAIRQLVRQGAERLADNRWVVIFPEGTRVAPGQKGRYHVGGAMLAERTGAIVIPVAHNAGRCWGRNSFLKRPGTISVRIGPPLPTQGKSAAEILRMVEEWIEARMAEIDPPQKDA
jgi:1-acyl-sn-glycerol-3-phosphate acyltransferase